MSESKVTPEVAEKAAQFFDIIQISRATSKDWWADAQERQIDIQIEKDRRIAELESALLLAQPITTAMAEADNAVEFQQVADAVDAALSKIGGAA